MNGSSAAVPAAITVSVAETSVTQLLGDKAAMVACFGEGRLDGSDIAFSLKPAPGERGTEVHATSHERKQEELKAGLRRLKALLEAGEIPTGARR